MIRFNSKHVVFFSLSLFINCNDISLERKKNILGVNQKLLSEESYIFNNFRLNTPKDWVLVNPKDSINLIFLSPIDSSMLLVNVTQKFDSSGFLESRYAEFSNNGIDFEQYVFQNSVAIVFDIKVRRDDDSLGLYFAVPQKQMNDNLFKIESSLGSIRLE